MERAQLSMMGQLLSKARFEQRLSRQEVAERLQVDPATVAHWERGETMPQPVNAWGLCQLYGKTPQELGLEEEENSVNTEHLIPPTEPVIPTKMSFSAFQQRDWTLRLERIVWSWSSRHARYHELQMRIIVELEDNTTMNPDDTINRREALYRLALFPLTASGLTVAAASLKQAPEEILTQCSAGIIACWYLRRGKELVFASDVVSSYLPTLKAIAQTGSTSQRKAAAELVGQSLLLKAVLSWNITTPVDGIEYAQQAGIYGKEAENPLLQITALRTQAAALCYANQWKQALSTAQQAKRLIDITSKERIPQLVRSYVYAGLATYQAYCGQEQDALTSLKRAHATFFERPADEVVPIWIDHSVGNLLLNDGLTHTHLGLYEGAVDSFAQIQENYPSDMTIPLGCRIEAQIEQVMAEVSRDDQLRDMEQCVALWTKGIEGAKTIQSNKHFNDAIVAYKVMRTVWPGEQRIRELRDHAVHW